MTGLDHPRRRLLRALAAAAALAALPGAAAAQTYPTKPITVVVPFPAGGPSDTIARVVGERMRAPLGQPVVIENVAGANGSIGVGKAARSAPDGYTLSIGQVATHVFNGATYQLQYDVLADFEPIALLTDSRFMIVGRPTLPVSDLAGLVAWLKANPGKGTMAMAGVGSMAHVSGHYLQRTAGVTFEMVPYRGGAPAMQGVLAGETDFMISDLVSALPQMRGGKIKAFAVAGPARLATAPDVPTVDEAGVKGLYVSFWHGLWAPKGTPADVIAKLNAAAREALADPAVKSRLADVGQDVFPPDQQSPAALRTHQKAEADKWWPIIKAAGIKGE